MISLNLKDRRMYLIAGLIAIFSLFAIWIRLIPMFNMGNTDILMMVASDDPLYNLRQVEQILANFPNYGWFDAMSLYPYGSYIYWGPLFPTIIAVCCMITGAATRPEIIGVGLLVPPIMGAAIVAIMYFVGKTCGDWKTGLLASGFTAVVSGQFFYRSFYGYMDHHIAEVLFSTLFCLFYMYALLLEKTTKIDLKNIGSYKKTILLSALAGIAYVLGLFTMPTIILFAMIVGVFTVIQFIFDVYRNRSGEYLLVINVVIFTIAIAGLLLFGFRNAGLNLSAYTVGHIYAYLGLIGGTCLLFLIARSLKGKNRFYYPAILAGCALIFAAVLYIFSPQIYNLLIYNFFSFFGQAAVTTTVQEARGWTPELAWTTFNYGLLLTFGGVLVMLYNNIRDEHPEQVFSLVWSLIILISTWQHVRYEYYFAVNLALLSAVCVRFAFNVGWKDIRVLAKKVSPDHDPAGQKTSPGDAAPRVKKQKKSAKKSSANPPIAQALPVAVCIIIITLSLLFAYASVSLSYNNAVNGAIRMNADWKESLDWLGNNTPDTGVNYYTIYNPGSFKYPDGSYGVMSWWDYGHMITYISKRIPNANPFQQGVAGDMGAAAYFISTSENAANTILDHLGTRYVITDIEMDSGKFWAMATWANSTLATSPYQVTMLISQQGNSNMMQPILLNNQQYYLTMISRLHNFDGSMIDPTAVYYIEYASPEITKVSLPVITSAQAMNATEAVRLADDYNLKAQAGYHAQVLSPSPILPVGTVPALRHYRLVHESPTNIFNAPSPDVKYVKIFEYVKGAHIKGDGIITVPIVTDTGRQYTYSQASVNGEFIVPYSTTGNPYNVKTTGKYTIIGTGRQYEVPDAAVIDGMTVQ